MYTRFSRAYPSCDGIPSAFPPGVAFSLHPLSYTRSASPYLSLSLSPPHSQFPLAETAEYSNFALERAINANSTDYVLSSCPSLSFFLSLSLVPRKIREHQPLVVDRSGRHGVAEVPRHWPDSALSEIANVKCSKSITRGLIQPGEPSERARFTLHVTSAGRRCV